MKLEPTFTYGDNVLFCVFEPDEDTSEKAVLPKLEAQGYTAWGVAQEEGVEEAIKVCKEEGAKEIVLCPIGWDPKLNNLPTEYTLFIKT